MGRQMNSGRARTCASTAPDFVEHSVEHLGDNYVYFQLFLFIFNYLCKFIILNLFIRNLLVIILIIIIIAVF